MKHLPSLLLARNLAQLKPQEMLVSKRLFQWMHKLFLTWKEPQRQTLWHNSSSQIWFFKKKTNSHYGNSGLSKKNWLKRNLYYLFSWRSGNTKGNCYLFQTSHSFPQIPQIYNFTWCPVCVHLCVCVWCTVAIYSGDHLNTNTGGGHTDVRGLGQQDGQSQHLLRFTPWFSFEFTLSCRKHLGFPNWLGKLFMWCIPLSQISIYSLFMPKSGTLW